MMFTNNFHCGAFMRRFQKHIIQTYGPPEKNIFFQNHSSEQTGEISKNFMIDMGVYVKILFIYFNHC